MVCVGGYGGYGLRREAHIGISFVLFFDLSLVSLSLAGGMKETIKPHNDDSMLYGFAEECQIAKAVCATLRLISRYMWSEKPWQLLRRCQSSDGGFF